MSWLSRKKNRPGTLRTADSTDVQHLEQFVRSRGDVEAFLEPRTAVTETTVVLVASTGEWTRRRVANPEAARAFAHKHAVPIYDVEVVGYPQRMRDWTAQRKANGDVGPPSRGESTG
ncbi:MAG TPA: hypothetical protein VJ831_15495 [Jatrophihabitantaceae bacterium]|nr:hypothetical protein [Jatrophihabitantaceae bacterium]